MLVTFSISVDVQQGYHVMASRKKETVLRKVLKHERKTSPKANIPGPLVRVVVMATTVQYLYQLVKNMRNANDTTVIAFICYHFYCYISPIILPDVVQGTCGFLRMIGIESVVETSKETSVSDLTPDCKSIPTRYAIFHKWSCATPNGQKILPPTSPSDI